MKKMIQFTSHLCSRMMMANIALFIAWGFLSALFSEGGWFPNKEFARMITPFIKYILPSAIAYQGGNLIYDKRGGSIAVIACMGAICSGDKTMLFEAMCIGPCAAKILKSWDEKIKKWTPVGFEMLVNNASIALLGICLALINYVLVSLVMNTIFVFAYQAVLFLIHHHFLPFLAFVIEPCKVLFLNNALNHGVFTPLGMEQVKQSGQSILYLIESNPGPGCGILLALFFRQSKAEKQTLLQAIVIQFFGGIHEIYFPYVLMNPILLVGLIGGSMTSIFIEQLLQIGLYVPVSPGSILSLLAMSSSNMWWKILLSVLFGALVSFLLSYPLLFLQKTRKKEKIECPNQVEKIVFVCDSGLGSSALGAGLLKRKLRQRYLDLTVEHCAYDQVKEADLIICHHQLEAKVQKMYPNTYIIGISDFLNAPEYDQLIEQLEKKI